MPANQSSNGTYRERVYPNPLALIWLLLVFPTCYLTFLPIDETIGSFLGVFLTLAIATNIWLSTTVIELEAGVFSVANAEIPVSVIESVEVVSAAAVFEERGPKLNPRAFVKFTATVNTMVKINLNDPEDPTPYWLVSTRRAEEIAEQLIQAKK